MVSVVFEHVRGRITAADVHDGSMFGAETVRDDEPHTIRSDKRQLSAHMCRGRRWRRRCSSDVVLSTAMHTCQRSAVQCGAVRCGEGCWWRLQRGERSTRGDAGFGRRTAGSRLVLVGEVLSDER
jgi:hypothetical protein